MQQKQTKKGIFLYYSVTVKQEFQTMEYGIIFWGDSVESKRMFQQQKKITRIMTESTSRNSRKTLFQHRYIYIVHSFVFLKLLKRYKQSNTTHQLFVKHTKMATYFGFMN
jgi:effector-binding domain-containing protein